MDEPWVCTKCGFTNEYYAAYCVSCSEIRPAEPAESQTPEPRTARPDYKWDYAPPTPTAKIRRPEEKNAPQPVAHKPAMPAPLPTPTPSGRRPFVLPKNFAKVVGVVIWIIIVTIVIPALRCTAEGVVYMQSP